MPAGRISCSGSATGGSRVWRAGASPSLIWKTEEARAAIVEFFQKSAVTMAVCYAGLLLFAVSFFLAVAAGITSLPRWACLCNTLPLFLAAAAFRIVGTGNLVNAGMFLGLIFLL